VGFAVRNEHTNSYLECSRESSQIPLKDSGFSGIFGGPEWRRGEADAIKFCHVDGAHDYPSVLATLQFLMPRLVEGAVIFGHDYETAHVGRGDLQGGVERAVRELLPQHIADGNTWSYRHLTKKS
jgi:hypothetical protein